MGSLKNCGIVRGQRSGNLFLHRQPFFDRGSRSEGSGQILLVGAKVGRHCRSSRLCCEGLQVGRRGRQHLCWSGLQVGGGRVGGMGGFAVRWDGWCSRGGGMSLKNGGFSSRPPATLFIKSPTQNLRELQRPRSPSPTVRGAQRGQPNSLGVHSTCNCVTTLSWSCTKVDLKLHTCTYVLSTHTVSL